MMLMVSALVWILGLMSHPYWTQSTTSDDNGNGGGD